MIYVVVFELWNEDNRAYSYIPIAAHTSPADAERHSDNLNEELTYGGFDSYYVDTIPLNP